MSPLIAVFASDRRIGAASDHRADADCQAGHPIATTENVVEEGHLIFSS
jgi:hypothetical protein